MHLPSPRGRLSAELTAALRHPPGFLPAIAERTCAVVGEAADPLADEDVQLSLYVLYELHYRGFDGVDARWDWSPDLLRARAVVEHAVERALRDRAQMKLVPVPRPGDVAGALHDLVADGVGPPLSAYLARRATLEQFREVLIHRSVLQLKAGDPWTWAIPRLTGRAKAALARIQIEESGRSGSQSGHALFAQTMRALSLDDAYGAYVDRVSGVALAQVNVATLFGLHRRLRGACIGHLTAHSLTVTDDNRQYEDGLRRLGRGGEATVFDEHIDANVPPARLGLDVCGALVEDQPQLRADVFFGMSTALVMDRLLAGDLLGAWSAGHSSLRPDITSRTVG